MYAIFRMATQFIAEIDEEHERDDILVLLGLIYTLNKPNTYLSTGFVRNVANTMLVPSKLINLLSKLKPSLNFLKPIHKEMDPICSVLKCLKANTRMKELPHQN